MKKKKLIQELRNEIQDLKRQLNQCEKLVKKLRRNQISVDAEIASLKKENRKLKSLKSRKKKNEIS